MIAGDKPGDIDILLPTDHLLYSSPETRLFNLIKKLSSIGTLSVLISAIDSEYFDGSPIDYDFDGMATLFHRTKLSCDGILIDVIIPGVHYVRRPDVSVNTLAFDRFGALSSISDFSVIQVISHINKKVYIPEIISGLGGVRIASQRRIEKIEAKGYKRLQDERPAG